MLKFFLFRLDDPYGCEYTLFRLSTDVCELKGAKMLHKAHSLIGTKIHATDGEMGHIEDFYFDDAKWMIRYMIVRTGSWFSDKRVMLAPNTIHDVAWERRSLSVTLSKEQVLKSPDLTMEMPVT